MNYIGENLRLEIFGGSHEPELGMTLRGFPAGEAVDAEALASFLARRAPGRSAWSSPRSEKDEPLFRSGLTDGMSDGSPITAVIANADARPGDYRPLSSIPRPGHADYAAWVKTGSIAPGGGAYSGRMTAALCLAGGLCLQYLERRGVRVLSRIAELGGIADGGELSEDSRPCAFGTLSEDMAVFLDACVRARLNILVSGGTGSGKTTTLNVLSSFIPETDRIVTIEDAAELRLQQNHIVTLEARPANLEGHGAITIRDLVRNALRMRPDRIIVGEVRSGEALDMLQAMNTGHDGSLTTAHANTPRDVLSRLETMVLMAGMELPVRAVRTQVSSAIDLIIQQSRIRDGSRKITHITEVQGMEGDTIILQDLFRYVQDFIDAEGKSVGHYESMGLAPQFMDKFKMNGIDLPLSFFSSRG